MKNIVPSALVSLIVALTAIYFFAPQGGAGGAPEKKESVYERVMRTREIRCGYVIYPPYFMKDPTTKKFSGISYELMERIGKELGLKVNWAEEAGMSTAFEGLQSRRYDANCVGFWAIPTRSMVANFSKPFYYDAYYAFKRKGDDRFNSIEDIKNNTNAKIVILEGEVFQYLIEEEFPDHSIVMLPQLSDATQTFVDVAFKKADITFRELSTFGIYNKSNPDLLELVTKNPYKIGQAGISLPVGEHELLHIINTTIDYINSSGFTQRVLDKYKESGILPVAKPYEVPAP